MRALERHHFGLAPAPPGFAAARPTPQKVHEILAYLDLESVGHTVVSGLPFGTQKRVDWPVRWRRSKILLLDEPAGGLNHGKSSARRPDPPDQGRAPHDRALGRAPHGSGDVDRQTTSSPSTSQDSPRETPAQVQADPDVIKAYLGSKTNDRDAQRQDLRAYYGQVQAASRPFVLLNEGSLTTLARRQRAGKTTTLRAICNMVRLDRAVEFDGKPLSGRSTENVVRLGIAHVPQGRGTFTTMTVEENLPGSRHHRHRQANSSPTSERMYAHSRC